ncbi:MAG: NADAR family protein [Myxococcales bacterium]|nr:NADAR family protein [Myxococcales bacterium]
MPDPSPARRLLALRLDARHVHEGARALDPYLLHQPGLPRVVALDDGGKLLPLHPRIHQPADLPPDLVADLTARLHGHFAPHDLPLPDPAWRRLHVVQFASRSKDAPALAPGLPRSWRRYLSNFASLSNLSTLSSAQPLRIDGHAYATVEHYFQARKAACSTRPEMAAWFTLEHAGPHRVGPDPREAKQAGARKGYRTHGAELDVARWVEVRELVMRTAIEARWAQDELFRRILVSTRGLRLLHFERAGARSFWGGSLDATTGELQGTNRLGAIMTERRDRPA